MTATLVKVQAGLIAKLKTDAALLALLHDPLEIREIEWMGGKFSYPNVRVRVSEFERLDANCDTFKVTARILVFGEDASSMLTNSIASEIYDFMDRKQIQNANLTTITRVKATQYGAEYVQESGAWQSEVRLQFQVK